MILGDHMKILFPNTIFLALMDNLYLTNFDYISCYNIRNPRNKIYNKLLHKCNRTLDTADEVTSKVEVQSTSRKYQN